jgi:hypothetical protein
MDTTMSSYTPPLALTIVAGVFLALGGLCGFIVLLDIVIRQGWKSMMWIMIPTYPITALYMGPIGMFMYFKYGRAASPKDLAGNGGGHGHMHHHHDEEKEVDSTHHNHEVDNSGHEHHDQSHGMSSQEVHDQHKNHPISAPQPETPQTHEMTLKDIHMHDMGGPPRPFWATLMIGISHCGAGCVLGDVIAEFIIYGSGATINGRDIWPCLLLDYAFALLFGIIFQYFSIAPMSGEYGLKTLIRAAKADILSLTFFEIGLFGWMVAYQVGIWNYQLLMISWVYWWMMQVGMFLGFWTALPINYWLLKRGIKEPCA